jgi:tripartite-type tricarboxylate transporter receptor subunit TctC
MFAPRNAAPETITRPSELLREILGEPATCQRLAEIGFEAQWASPREFAERISGDIEL